MKNKRGWLRILEATTAILIISSVLLVVYSRQVKRSDLSDSIFVLQREILAEISSNAEYRTDVLSYDGDPDEFNQWVAAYVSGKIPGGLGHKLRVCDLTDPCKLNGVLTDPVINAIRTKELYVEGVVIAADVNAGLYSPKKVRLFVWEDK